jgi:hypothetical protein
MRDIEEDRKRGTQCEIDFARWIVDAGGELIAVHADVRAAMNSIGPVLPDSSPCDALFRLFSIEYAAEIKSKKPTEYGRFRGKFGLERYRLDKLAAARGVPLYVIFDSDAGKWRVAYVSDLIEKANVVAVRNSPTYFGGEEAEKSTWYWPVDCWTSAHSWLEAIQKVSAPVAPPSRAVFGYEPSAAPFAARFERLCWLDDVVADGIGRFRCDCGREIVAKIGVIAGSRPKHCGCLNPAPRRRRAA